MIVKQHLQVQYLFLFQPSTLSLALLSCELVYVSSNWFLATHYLQQEAKVMMPVLLFKRVCLCNWKQSVCQTGWRSTGWLFTLCKMLCWGEVGKGNCEKKIIVKDNCINMLFPITHPSLSTPENSMVILDSKTHFHGIIKSVLVAEFIFYIYIQSNLYTSNRND